ncbi:hypothetical protein [Streptosporangium sp. NPDC050280]|uniref:hypothetical protein n=1 Tax=unclassified Streptosporangium TaxID=2632669 RepID=UPI00341B9AE1
MKFRLFPLSRKAPAHPLPVDCEVAMRTAMEGTPHARTAVGKVVGHDHTANEGAPCVIVTWLGPEGFTATYHLEALVRVKRGGDGTPRPL